MHTISRWGPAAAFAGGLLWLLVSVHGFAAHGLTTVNKKQVVLGLTWMDSGKLLVASFLLFFVAAVALSTRLERKGRVDWSARWITAGALLTLAIGTALQFWPFPWGSYAAEATRFAAPVPSAGGALRAMASLVLTAGLLLVAWLLVRARALAWWSGVALAISGPAAFFLTPVLPVSGLAWIVVGVGLGRSRRRAAVPPEPSSAPS